MDKKLNRIIVVWAIGLCISWGLLSGYFFYSLYLGGGNPQQTEDKHYVVSGYGSGRAIQIDANQFKLINFLFRTGSISSIVFIFVGFIFYFLKRDDFIAAVKMLLRRSNKR
jgi:hypothetical protein